MATKTADPADEPKPTSKKAGKADAPPDTSHLEPYPTGDPKTPQTWAEINGLVPIGTGQLVPAEPPAKKEE